VRVLLQVFPAGDLAQSTGVGENRGRRGPRARVRVRFGERRRLPPRAARAGAVRSMGRATGNGDGGDAVASRRPCGEWCLGRRLVWKAIHCNGWKH
jgi:hypothetical protein